MSGVMTLCDSKGSMLLHTAVRTTRITMSSKWFLSDVDAKQLNASYGKGLLDVQALAAAVSAELLKRSNITALPTPLLGPAIIIDDELPTIQYQVRPLAGGLVLSMTQRACLLCRYREHRGNRRCWRLPRLVGR
jgi:hypothetical protein